MHEPEFFKRQVLMKVVPGENSVPSGTVTSETNVALSQPAGATTVGGGEANGVRVAAGGGSGVRVAGNAGGSVVPARMIRGDPQIARSPLADPLASTMKTN